MEPGTFGTSSSVEFQIDGWKTWGQSLNGSGDVSVIPPLLRRRLSFIGRAALSVAIPLTNEFGDMPSVYISRHGEVNRTLTMLKDLAHKEPLSPTAFSLSVHNAVAGLYSIHNGSKKAITALSGGVACVVSGLLEALAMLSSQEPRVLCIFCDEPPPPIYQESFPSTAFAIGMVVSSGNQYELKSFESDKNAKKQEETDKLIRFLESGGSEVILNGTGNAWQLLKRFQA